MITYNKTREVEEKWGIDVTTQFYDGKKPIDTITFRFDDKDQVEKEYDERMLKAVTRIEEELLAIPELTPDEKLQQIEEEIAKTGSLSVSKYNEIAKKTISEISIEPVVEKEI